MTLPSYPTIRRYTLKRDNESVAALFLSLYPIFQTCQDDNTYHLQAFRHLWVIAAQPRYVGLLFSHSIVRCINLHDVVYLQFSAEFTKSFEMLCPRFDIFTCLKSNWALVLPNHLF